MTSPAAFDFVKADSATSSYVNMDIAKKLIKMALIGSWRNPLRANLIQWGPGGFGKSEFTHDYIEAATGINPYVLSFNKEISTAETQGGLDLPALQSGTLKYLVDQSWMAHEIAIFEEAFDAPDSVLLAMKDTITRGIFTIGQNFQVKTKLIVINTNHDPSRFQADLSKSAFLERFPYTNRVDWSNLSLGELNTSYRQLIDNRFNGTFGYSIKSMLSAVAATEMWSPRKTIQVCNACIDMAEIEQKPVDTDVLMSVSKLFGFNSADAIERIKREELDARIADFNAKVGNLLDSYRLALQNATKGNDMNKTHKTLADIKARLGGVQDSCVNARNEFGERSNQVIDSLLERLEEIKGEAFDIWANLM